MYSGNSPTKRNPKEWLSRFPDFPSRPESVMLNAKPMTSRQIRDHCGAFSGFGRYGCFGIVYGGRYTYVFFSVRLQDAVRTPAERKKLPAGAKFVIVRYCDEDRLALRFRAFSYTGFLGRIAERLNRRLYGDPKREARKGRLDRQNQYHTRHDIEMLWEIQQGRCLYSGKALGRTFSTAQFSTDHIKPLALGGHDGPSNLGLVTLSINAQKKHTDHYAFMDALGLTKARRDRIRLMGVLRRRAFRDVNRFKRDRYKRA